MNLAVRSAALLMATAATLVASPQQARSKGAPNSEAVVKAVSEFHKACNENITITKAINIKLSTIAPSLMWKTCTAAEIANVTSQCIWANAHAVDAQAVKGTTNCLKQHTVAVATGTYTTVKKMADSIAETKTGKTISTTINKTAAQQVNAAKKDYGSVKRTVNHIGNIISGVF